MVVVSLAAMPLARITGWDQSPILISQVSLLALALAEGGSWQASRVEVRQEELAEADGA